MECQLQISLSYFFAKKKQEMYAYLDLINSTTRMRRHDIYLKYYAIDYEVGTS